MKRNSEKVRNYKKLQTRKMRIRKKMLGSPERPRVSVFKSNTNLYSQIVDDSVGKTLVSISLLEKDLKEKIKMNVEGAKELGKIFGKRAAEKGISAVVFDRNGKKYHGRIKAFAEGMRESGVSF